MKTSRYLLLALPSCLLLVLAGCGKENENCVYIPDTSGINVSVEIERLEDIIPAFRSKEELVQFFTNYPVVRDHFFMRRDYPNDSIFINELYTKMTHPSIDTLHAEVRRTFGDLSALKDEFQRAFTNLKFYYPDFVPPKVQTVISGFQAADLLITDSLIIVGLDYYLGPEGKYRPQVYDYQLSRYEPDDIVPSCLLVYGIKDRFNQSDLSNRAALADIVAYGKAFYFAKHMLPCVPDSVFLWYTAEEIQGAFDNQKLIWYRFVEDEVLYSTSHIVKQKFLMDRPKTVEVGDKCPGRIGQWVGWQIVKKYMETHPETSLPDLMQISDAQKLFKESRYKP